MGPFVRHFSAVLVALSIIPSIWAQWIVPNENAEDLSEKWTVGDTLPIAWGGWAAAGEQPANCDLWITTFRNGAVEERILANVKMDRAGDFDWKINLTSSQVSKDPQFVLRFVEHVNSESPSFPVDSPMMGSRGFYLYPEVALTRSSTSTSATPTPTPSSSRTPSMTTSVNTSETTSASSSMLPTPTDSASGSGATTTALNKKKSNTGAIAGGVLGGLVVLALLLAGVLVLLRRQRKKKEATALYGNKHMDEKRQVDAYAYEMETPPVELPASQHHAPELQGSFQGQYVPRKQDPYAMEPGRKR